tara:strand:+ start:16697 stop:17227 length:531 start_codon:yes stop_codon:yes gene_type:complete
MDINEILKMNPDSECKITYDGYEEWKNCYYQKKNDSSVNLDTDKLPLLDDEYIQDTGEPLYNDNNEEVFDPSQEIEYEYCYTMEYQTICKSKTLIGLLQNKIKELIDSGDYDPDDEYSEFSESLGIYHGRGFLDEFFYSVECNDIVILEEKEDDSLLWYTSSQLDEESGSISLEEI